MPGTHALLSPSAAHRWMNCTAAPRLERTEPDKDSPYALEGTLAHAFCARSLKSYLHLPVDAEDKEIAELYGEYGSGEMAEYVETYTAIVLEKFAAAKAKTPDALLLVEVRLDFSQYIPNAFGTADAIIIADGTMEIIDFKYGKGVKVSAKHNPQMMIYALGAYEAFSFEYAIDKVRMTIVQPRIDNLSEDVIAVTDLINWAVDELAPKAKEADEGGTTKPGEWCQFCRIKHKCKALAQMAVDTAEAAADFADPDKVSKEMMESVILPALPIIKTWLTGVEEYALQQALAGVNYAGYKVVEGRSNRKITDPEAVRKALSEAGFNEAAYMKPPELISLTELEKLTGKKKFAAMCGGYLTKPQGKPTLAPESDKRPAFNAATDDFKDIPDEKQ